MASASPRSSRSAGSPSPRWRSLSTPEKIIGIGVDLFCPLFLGDLAADRVEQTVGVLHDVRLGHGGDLLAAVGTRVVEGEFRDPAGAGDRDRLDRDPGVVADAPGLQAVQELAHLRGVWSAMLEVD